MRRVPGTTLTNQATGKVIYTPPVGESLLRDKLANWERFIHDHTEVDPLIRMAVAHYQLLAVTQKSAWEQWVLNVLKGVNETAAWTTEKINAIRGLMAHTTGPVRERLPKIYSRELVELTFVQSCCRIQNLVESDLAHRETASKYLKDLAQIGVLEEVQAGPGKAFHSSQVRAIAHR